MESDARISGPWTLSCRPKQRSKDDVQREGWYHSQDNHHTRAERPCNRDRRRKRHPVQSSMNCTLLDEPYCNANKPKASESSSIACLTYTPLIIRLPRIPACFQSIFVDSEDEKFVSVPLLDSWHFIPRPMLIVLRFCLVYFPSKVLAIQSSILEPALSVRGRQEVPAAMARHVRLITY